MTRNWSICLCVVVFLLVAQQRSSMASAGYSPHYVGCFRDTPNRMMASYVRCTFGPRDGNSLESCTAAVKAKGFAYAGMQFYACFGSNDLELLESVGAGTCAATCDANPHEICGLNWANSVYQVVRSPPPLSRSSLTVDCDVLQTVAIANDTFISRDAMYRTDFYGTKCWIFTSQATQPYNLTVDLQAGLGVSSVTVYDLLNLKNLYPGYRNSQGVSRGYPFRTTFDSGADSLVKLNIGGPCDSGFDGRITFSISVNVTESTGTIAHPTKSPTAEAARTWAPTKKSTKNPLLKCIKKCLADYPKV